MTSGLSAATHANTRVTHGCLTLSQQMLRKPNIQQFTFTTTSTRDEMTQQIKSHVFDTNKEAFFKRLQNICKTHELKKRAGHVVGELQPSSRLDKHPAALASVEVLLSESTHVSVCASL